jgi:hypothetical protein
MFRLGAPSPWLSNISLGRSLSYNMVHLSSTQFGTHLGMLCVEDISLMGPLCSCGVSDDPTPTTFLSDSWRCRAGHPLIFTAHHGIQVRNVLSHQITMACAGCADNVQKNLVCSWCNVCQVLSRPSNIRIDCQCGGRV